MKLAGPTKPLPSARPLPTPTHEARIQIPQEARRNLTFERFDEILETIRGIGGAEVTTNKDKVPTSILVSFFAESDYELAMQVRDLQEMLNAYDYSVWEVPRPMPVSKNS